VSECGRIGFGIFFGTDDRSKPLRFGGWRDVERFDVRRIAKVLLSE
jgi:hypothetical protein